MKHRNDDHGGDEAPGSFSEMDSMAMIEMDNKLKAQYNENKVGPYDYETRKSDKPLVGITAD